MPVKIVGIKVNQKAIKRAIVNARMQQVQALSFGDCNDFFANCCNCCNSGCCENRVSLWPDFVEIRLVNVCCDWSSMTPPFLMSHEVPSGCKNEPYYSKTFADVICNEIGGELLLEIYCDCETNQLTYQFSRGGATGLVDIISCDPIHWIIQGSFEIGGVLCDWEFEIVELCSCETPPETLTVTFGTSAHCCDFTGKVSTLTRLDGFNCPFAGWEGSVTLDCPTLDGMGMVEVSLDVFLCCENSVWTLTVRDGIVQGSGNVTVESCVPFLGSGTITMLNNCAPPATTGGDFDFTITE